MSNVSFQGRQTCSDITQGTRGVKHIKLTVSRVHLCGDKGCGWRGRTGASEALAMPLFFAAVGAKAIYMSCEFQAYSKLPRSHLIFHRKHRKVLSGNT